MSLRGLRLSIILGTLVFLAVIIVLNSLTFTVRKIDAYCLNDEDEALRAEISRNSGIGMGQNIFFMSAEKARRGVDERFPDIRVINIERKFPDRVTVNFVKIVPIMALGTDGGGFITIDNDLKIHETNATDVNFTATVQEFDAAGRHNTLTKLVTSARAVSPEPKADIKLNDERQNALLKDAVRALNRLNYREYDFVKRIQSIDLGGADGPKIILQTRPETRSENPVEIQLWSPESRLLEKMRYAVSIYEQHLKGTLATPGGKLPSDKIKVVEDNKNLIYAVV